MSNRTLLAIAGILFTLNVVSSQTQQYNTSQLSTNTNKTNSDDPLKNVDKENQQKNEEWKNINNTETTTQQIGFDTKGHDMTSSNEQNTSQAPQSQMKRKYGSRWRNHGGYGIGGRRVGWGGWKKNQTEQEISKFRNVQNGVTLTDIASYKRPLQSNSVQAENSVPPQTTGNLVNESATPASKLETSNIPPFAGGGIGGDRVLSGEMTSQSRWHVGIYELECCKTWYKYKLVCGGSLVTPMAVITAADCFWRHDDNDDDYSNIKTLQLFLVEAGASQTFRVDSYVQKTDSTRTIAEVKIPPRFRGRSSNYQDNIAVVKLTAAINASPAVKPICVNFDASFDNQQLNIGSIGTVVGWTLADSSSSFVRNLHLPYVDIEDCMTDTPTNCLKYITSDKICARIESGISLCNVENGAGLAYITDSPPVPYLRGVMSTSAIIGNDCLSTPLVTFTHLLPHKEFLLKHIPDLGEKCWEYYPNAHGIADTRVDNEDKYEKKKTVNFVCNCFCNGTSSP